MLQVFEVQSNHGRLFCFCFLFLQKHHVYTHPCKIVEGTIIVKDIVSQGSGLLCCSTKAGLILECKAFYHLECAFPFFEVMNICRLSNRSISKCYPESNAAPWVETNSTLRELLTNETWFDCHQKMLLKRCSSPLFECESSFGCHPFDW